MTLWNRSALRIHLFAAFCLITGGALAQNPPTTVNVDTAAGRHSISPLVYGIGSGTPDILSDLNCPLNRYGGNNSSRYNWQQNADNRGSDWFFESIGDDDPTPGGRGDAYFASSSAGGARLMLTVPTIGWIAKLGSNRAKLSSFSIAKYGAQTSNDSQFFSDAGNGILKSSGQNVTGNDPNDADVQADSTYQQGWISHLVSKWGLAANGGLRYYILDNEPSIWHATHRDVHSTGATMAEVRDKMADYASKIKAVDPGALIVGPEEWGWSGYFYSGFDQQYGSQHGWSSLPDRTANGGWDYLAWLLDQMRQKSAAAGTRLLDVFSVHYYPQGGEYGNDTSTATQLLRNKSTRSLWDPTYVDQSWINDKVQLIPRLKSWVNTYYPGTKTALTEYNWGAEGHINGATTQADIFGILGREGIDIAARWTWPDPSTPTYKAMKMYRNYDGLKSTFGETSVSAAVANPDNLSAFASVRAKDGALTIAVINKVLTGSTPVTLSLAHFQASGAAQVWQLTASNAITRLGDANVLAGTLTTTVPAQSISLFIVPGQDSSSAPVYQINAGGSSAGSFAADNYFSGGFPWSTTSSIDISGVTNPAPMSAYQVCRVDYSAFSYSFPNLTAGASYKLRLHFAEPYWTIGGQRLINVSANGTTILTNFDAFTAAGGALKAVVEEFTVAADPNGKINLSFTGNPTANDPHPLVCAIEVAPGNPQAPSTPTGLTALGGNTQIALAWNSSAGATSYNVYRATSAGGEGATPYRTGIASPSFTDTGLTNGTTYYYRVSAVNAIGESPLSAEVSAKPTSVIYQINAGGSSAGSFAADNYFSGGFPWSTTSSIDISGVTNPAPMSAYQVCRVDYSAFSYSFPNLTAGASYKLRLHFAEPYWTIGGQRLINVSANGTAILTNFDAFTAAGGALKAVVEEFTVAADPNGKINLSFTGNPTANDPHPLVCAIEIVAP